MGCTSLPYPYPLHLPLDFFVMLTGHLTQMIGEVHLGLLSTLGLTWYLGGLKSSMWWLGPALNMNLEAWLMLQLMSCGFKLSLKSCSLTVKLLKFCVTISLPCYLLIILLCTPRPSIWRLISSLYGRRF